MKENAFIIFIKYIPNYLKIVKKILAHKEKSFFTMPLLHFLS